MNKTTYCYPSVHSVTQSSPTCVGLLYCSLDCFYCEFRHKTWPVYSLSFWNHWFLPSSKGYSHILSHIFRFLFSIPPTPTLFFFFFSCFSSVQFSHSVVSHSLQPHELQHARPSCPSPTPGVHSDSCPSSQWYHPAISSSVIPFSSCPQSLPASESFPMSQLFAWGGQSTGVSASASFLPKKSQGWSPTKGLSRVFSNTAVQKHQFFSVHLPSQSNSHIHTWPLEKP